MGRILMVAITLALPVAVQAASKRMVESWGKSGIGFAQYRADAIECAKTGYFRDVSQDEPAKRFIRGFETADNALNGGGSATDWTNSVLITQPDRQKRELQAIQVGDVEQCLTGKGYRRFTLTRAEAKTLSRYPRGSQARHQYLHSLAAR